MHSITAQEGITKDQILLCTRILYLKNSDQTQLDETLDTDAYTRSIKATCKEIIFAKLKCPYPEPSIVRKSSHSSNTESGCSNQGEKQATQQNLEKKRGTQLEEQVEPPSKVLQKIQITKQPPTIFTNQQHGKHHGFWVCAHTGNSTGDYLYLRADIVYECDLHREVKEVITTKTDEATKKPMLQILDKREVDAGHTKIFWIYCRINDVSRNHMGRRFRIRLACVDATKCIAKAYTRPITVISKWSKSKHKRPSPGLRKSTCSDLEQKRTQLEAQVEPPTEVLQKRLLHMTQTDRNASMQITHQPPTIFTNQQHGKRHGFWVCAHTWNSAGDMFLQAALVYECDLHTEVTEVTTATKRPMLQIMKRRDFKAGHAKIYCRINDVSRNHMGRRFRIRLKWVDDAQCMYTRPIEVISKERKLKRDHPCPAPSTVCPDSGTVCPDSIIFRKSSHCSKDTESSCSRKEHTTHQRTACAPETPVESASSMQVTTQPPAIFTNQQHGKRHGFEVAVHAGTSSSGSLYLLADLVYADDFEPASASEAKKKSEVKKKAKQPMLQILEREDFNAGHAKIYCRINDVSRNHMGRRFRIRLTCVDLDGSGATGTSTKFVAKTYTRPIKVISKDLTARKRKRPRPASSAVRQSTRSPSRAAVSCWSECLDEVAAARRRKNDKQPTQQENSRHPIPKNTCAIPSHKRSRPSPTQQAKERMDSPTTSWPANRLQLLSNVCVQANESVQGRAVSAPTSRLSFKCSNFRRMLQAMPRQLGATFYTLYTVTKTKVACKGTEKFPQAQEDYEQTQRSLRKGFWHTVVATGNDKKFAAVGAAPMWATPRQRALAVFDKMCLEIMKFAMVEHATHTPLPSDMCTNAIS